MKPTLILWPAVAQVGLTMAMYIRLARAKDRARKDPGMDLRRAALHGDAWPDFVVQINNNIRNQFETPVLFYVLVGVLFALNAVSGLALVLAWSFAVLRIVHAFIHTGSNNVRRRLRVFTAACFCLIGLFAVTVSALIG